MMFHVGQKVTLVQDVSRQWDYLTAAGLKIPEFGVIYTVGQIRPDTPTGPGIRLVEIDNPPCKFVDGVHEVSFTVKAFRPIVKKQLPECLTRPLDAPVPEPIGG